MLKKILVLSILLSILMSCSEHKEKTEKRWCKGNLHAHSYWSDGNEFPEVIMDWYKNNGYDFAVLSDHNTLNEGDKWITLSDKLHLQKGFEEYLAKYGEEWVDHKIDSAGKTRIKLKTLEEYGPLFEEKEKFMILPSEELSTSYDKKPIHINATNVQERIAPLKGESTADVIQKNINAILAQREELGVPILPHVNHPNFRFAITAEDFIQLHNVRFFEVYNGHPAVFNEGDSTHISIEKMWDQINVAYYEQHKPLLNGVATDDSHYYRQLGKTYSNPGRGWVMVLVDSLSANSIIDGMEAGNFYASTGVVLKSIERKDGTLRIDVAAETEVDYEIQLIGVNAASKEVEIIEKVSGTNAEFALSDTYLYVRAKVISNKTNKNFFDETEFEKAWTQPIITKKRSDPVF